MIELKPTTQALAFSALTACGALAQSSPTASWDAPLDGPRPEIYHVYASKDPASLDEPKSSVAFRVASTTNTSVKLPRLEFATWTLAVTAANSYGESEFSQKVQFLALVAPKNLRLESGTNFMFPLKLVWDKSDSSTVFGDVQYRVYRRNRFPENARWSRITETRSTSYSAEVLQTGEFIYRVTTIKGGLESEFSSNDVSVRIRLAAQEIR